MFKSRRMPLLSSLLVVALLYCDISTAEPAAEPVSHPKSALVVKLPAIVPVPERKVDQAEDVGKEALKSQASNSGYGSRANDYNNQQQQQEYQPPPPPPPTQAYGQQVQVTEEDYTRDSQQQAYDPPQQQQAYDQQPQPQSYGVKGQSSRPALSSPQQSYPAAPAAQQQGYQPQSYQQPQQQQHSAYQPPAQTSQQQQSYPAAQSSYGSRENSYGSQAAGQSYGSSNAYQAPASSYSSNNNAAATQSYGAPLESTYENTADYSNDPNDDLPYDNADTGYGTSAPEQEQLSPSSNYHAPPQQSVGKGQGYQVAAPLAPAYPPPQPQRQPAPAPYTPPAPQSPPPPPPASQYAPSASAGYQQPQQHQDQGYGSSNGAAHEAAAPATPSKAGYAPQQASNNNYAPAPLEPGNSGSGSRYPETSYSYENQQQPQPQQGSTYNLPLNYGGFRPIQLAGQPVNSYGQKSAPAKPLVLAIVQKLGSSQYQQQQHSGYAAAHGDHYQLQLPTSALYGPSHEHNQYQPQQIPANSHSGPALPLNSYASPAPTSYQSAAGQSSYSPAAPANSYSSQSYGASQGSAPYPSSTGSSGQYQAPSQAAQQQNYQNYQPQQPSYGPGYEYATEQESSDDEYSSGGANTGEYAPHYSPAAPAYPQHAKAPVAQSYSNAGFALDYAEGKPYGGRWLQKPYGKKFVKAKKPYAGNADGFDVTIPLQYGPPPPPEEPKPSAAPYALAPYASMPQASIYPEESSAFPYGVPSRLPALSAAAFPPQSYQNPSLTQSYGSYGVQNHNLRIPSASSYGPLTSDESDLYAASLAAAAGKRKKQRTPVDADLAAGYPDEESGYKLIPSASKLIPNIVKSPFKRIMKAFSKNKLLSWKRQETPKELAKEVTKD